MEHNGDSLQQCSLYEDPSLMERYLG